MIKPSWKLLLLVAVVAVVLSSAAPQADAQWWGYRPVAAWGCCYTPSYSPCYATVGCGYTCNDGGWYLGWRPGPIRRLLLGRYRWYWGGYGCNYGCNYCCSYDCCTTYDSCCGGASSAAPAQAPTPARKPVAEPPAAMPSAPAPAPVTPPSNNTTSIDQSGVLTVWVPYDAKVTINGLQTTSVGSRRKFVSYGLKPGFSYKYEVRADLVRDGQVLTETRTIVLTAGQITAVAFGFNVNPAEQVAAVH